MKKLRIQKSLPSKKELEIAFNRLCQSLPDNAYASLTIDINKTHIENMPTSDAISISFSAYTDTPTATIYSSRAEDDLEDVISGVISKYRRSL